VQLVVLGLLMSVVPLILMKASEWRLSELDRQDMEWEILVNELLILIQQYDRYAQLGNHNYRIYVFKEGSSSFGELTLDGTVIEGINTEGFEPIVVSKSRFSYESLEDGIILRHHRLDGKVKERRFYIKRKEDGAFNPI